MRSKFHLCAYIQILLISLSSQALLPLRIQAQTVAWSQQLGSAKADYCRGIAIDKSGNVYISGSTEGSFAGINQGDSDTWLAKYTSQGKLVWKQQLGTASLDDGYGVAIDNDGNVYISGSTEGSFAGTNQGGYDAWVAKYTPNGKLAWKRQLGTRLWDESYSIATDKNNSIYISGYTNGSFTGKQQGLKNIWVAKYTSQGKLIWLQQLGSGFNLAESVATDTQGHVYISGYTNGGLDKIRPGRDAFVAKYTTNGKLVWLQQLGTSGLDYSYAVVTDKHGNVYISGYTSGSLAIKNQGLVDAWVAKYTSNGKLVWVRQLGTANFDYSYTVATDTKDHVYISGYSNGLVAATQTDADVLIAKYTPNGELLWKQMLGTKDDEFSEALVVNNDNIYACGTTFGALAGKNQGGADAWVVKYIQTPQQKIMKIK